MKLNRVLYLMFAAVVLAGCTGSDVGIVKEGVMGGYETTTVGAAFDASFDNPKWESLKGKKGERVVEFTGTISQTLHDSYVDKLLNWEIPPKNHFAEAVLSEREYQQAYEAVSGEGSTPEEQVYRILFEEACKKLAPVGSPVAFQWIVNTDGKSFSLSDLDYAAWGPNVLHFGYGQFRLGEYSLKDILDIIYG